MGLRRGDDLKETIRAYIARRFAAQLGREPLLPDTPLFSTGIIDSFGVLELIAFLEAQFGVTIDPGRHEIGDFDSTVKIAALIETLPSEGRE